MQRCRTHERPDWQAKFAALGFAFHSADGGYWDESACYRFSAGEIDAIDAAARDEIGAALAAAEAAPWPEASAAYEDVIDTGAGRWR